MTSNGRIGGDRRGGRRSFRLGMRRFIGVAGALVVVVLVAGPASANDISMGPQAMEGHLKASPGAHVQGGFDFSVSGNHGAATVSFVDAKITFTPFCANGGTYSGPTTIDMGSPTYSLAANDGDWIPSGDQSSNLVYQSIAAGGDFVVTNAMCGGGEVDFQHGGTFTADLQSSDTSMTVNVRWHYRHTFNGNTTSGSWSGTGHFTPDQTTVPVGTIGFIALAVLVAGALAVLQRRSRRRISGEVE